MLRTSLLAILLVAFAFAKDPPPTTAQPHAGDSSGSGDGGSGGPCTQGAGSAVLVLNLGPVDIATIDTAQFALAQQILVAQLGPGASYACSSLLATGNDKSGVSFAGYEFLGLDSATQTTASGMGGPNTALSTLFGFAVEVFVGRVNDGSEQGGDNGGDQNNGDDKITKAPPSETEYIPQITPCSSTAAGVVSFSVFLPGFSLPSFSLPQQTALRNFFGTILQTDNGCVNVVNIGYDADMNAIIDVQITGLADPDTAVGVIVANDKTNLIITAFGSNPATIVNLVASGVDKEVPTTTTTTTTPPFDYYTLLPQIISNIDQTTGLFNTAFQQRVTDGCQADRVFCVMAMNILTNYIATLASWNAGGDTVDKEGTQYSTTSKGGDSSLSLASVLAITGGVVAAVVVVALVVAKIKTGRFVPRRPSSRVSVSSASDTRTLTAHASRISVRAWPEAMEV